MARTKGLNSTRTRTRKHLLALRDGAWCAYCGHLFADLRQATIDHIAPYSLYRTWRIEATTLACHTCNETKADRLPLTLALLLTTWSQSADPMPDATADQSADSGRLTPDQWRTLARLAAAHESADRLPESADRHPERSQADQPVSPVHLTPVRTAVRTTAPDPTTRPDAYGEAA